ncbi:winged helix-turn-helix domain-containing protein [Streptomyces scabichelini]|uniref:winged helix-turn-helix domain-containing protein n=1 Tax=Streptomyces scabichelini TaxID=2711217 RepID=UPI001F49D8FF|nr:winged helix-turn-helix domain-containing protein [Streptomyces scabichelini]
MSGTGTHAALDAGTGARDAAEPESGVSSSPASGTWSRAGESSGGESFGGDSLGRESFGGESFTGDSGAASPGPSPSSYESGDVTRQFDSPRSFETGSFDDTGSSFDSPLSFDSTGSFDTTRSFDSAGSFDSNRSFDGPGSAESSRSFDGPGSAESSRSFDIPRSFEGPDPAFDPVPPPEAAAEEGATGPLVVDRRTRQVWVGESPVALTPKEFELLALLTEDPGAVYSRQQILDRVWDPHYEGPTKTLDVHVATLRRKLGNSAWIQTLRGVGFRLAVHTRPPTAYPESGRPAAYR